MSRGLSPSPLPRRVRASVGGARQDAHSPDRDTEALATRVECVVHSLGLGVLGWLLHVEQSCSYNC